MAIDQRDTGCDALRGGETILPELTELWKEVLQMTHTPQLSDNFFSVGGDSMTMVMLEFRIKEELSVELPVGAVLVAPTLGELSALIQTTVGERHASAPLAEDESRG